MAKQMDTAQRVAFIREWQRLQNAAPGRVDMTELSRRFGVSRPTAYRWVNRYLEGGRDLKAMETRSTRPHSSPSAVPEEIEDRVVRARKQHPRLGARKLWEWLEAHHPTWNWPSATTIGVILQRRGLGSRPIGRSPRMPPVTGPFAEATEPNTAWSIDHERIRIGEGQYYVVAIADVFSCYLLRYELLPPDRLDLVEAILEQAFREFGLPAAIRADSGDPFSSREAGGFTGLSVWLFRMSIRLDIRPAGRDRDRGPHRSILAAVKEATISPPRDHWREQQIAFDLFRRLHNEEHPQPALGRKPPASVYRASPRLYPTPLIKIENSLYGEMCPVDREGCIRWKRRKIYITRALFGHSVELVGLPEGWEVRFGPFHLGILEEKRLDRGIILPPRPRKAEWEVSPPP